MFDGDRAVEWKRNWLPLVIGGLIFLATFVRYRQSNFLGSSPRYVIDLNRRIVAGTANAPDQYRPLAPWVAHALSWLVDLPTAILVVDFISIAIGAFATAVLLSRMGLLRAFPIAALVFAFADVNSLEHVRPEMFPAFAVVTVGAVLLVREGDPSWWLLLLGAVLLGLRTDYAAALAVALLLIGWRNRSARAVGMGAGLLLAAVVATVALTKAYPQAKYPPGTAVVEVLYNLHPASLIMLVVFVAPLVLVPVTFTVTRREWPPYWALTAWFVVELAATAIVGRVEETRLYLPFATALAAGSLAAWRSLSRSRVHA